MVRYHCHQSNPILKYIELWPKHGLELTRKCTSLEWGAYPECDIVGGKFPSEQLAVAFQEMEKAFLSDEEQKTDNVYEPLKRSTHI